LVDNEPDQPAHDIEPPFVTDGRGRVVWSSMRPGRAVQAEVVHESSPTTSRLIDTGTTGITPRIKTRRAGRENNSTVGTTASNGFTTDGRGRVIGTGNPDTVDGHENEELAAPAVDAESDVQVAEPSQNGTRRSFFGRVYDVVFS